MTPDELEKLFSDPKNTTFVEAVDYRVDQRMKKILADMAEADKKKTDDAPGIFSHIFDPAPKADK